MTYYEIHGNHPVVKESMPVNIEELKLARMNEVIKADDKHPLLGTYALATCLCLIFIDKDNTYLAHIIDNYEKQVKDILNHMDKDYVCLLIPGASTEMTKIAEITLFLKKIDPQISIKVINLSEYRNEEYESIEFIYNTKDKTFIKTNFDILLGKER